MRILELDLCLCSAFSTITTTTMFLEFFFFSLFNLKRQDFMFHLSCAEFPYLAKFVSPIFELVTRAARGLFRLFPIFLLISPSISPCVYTNSGVQIVGVGLFKTVNPYRHSSGCVIWNGCRLFSSLIIIYPLNYSLILL